MMPGNNDQTVELRPVREHIVQHLLKESDPKKVVSFLSRCGVIEINQSSQEIVIGVPNEFVLTQVKKFFHKAMNQAVQETYNPSFKPIYRIYQDFQ
jgi:chromosomal replication initiation ATPase DnaA